MLYYFYFVLFPDDHSVGVFAEVEFEVVVFKADLDFGDGHRGSGAAGAGANLLQSVVAGGDYSKNDKNLTLVINEIAQGHKKDEGAAQIL